MDEKTKAKRQEAVDLVRDTILSSCPADRMFTVDEVSALIVDIGVSSIVASRREAAAALWGEGLQA